MPIQQTSDEGKNEGKTEKQPPYISITPEELTTMLAKKDFVLVDVHVPEQEHIMNTDLFIPYDKIEQNLDKLPTDKNAKIVVYCRSGSMSRTVVYQLAGKGYTNVYDLVGGKRAYDEFLKSTDKVADLTASQKVGRIRFDATIITEANLEKMNSKLDGKLTEMDLDLKKTLIFLELNNHGDDLSVIDYQKLTTLNNKPTEKWQLLSSAMGGHHVTGVLTFAYDDKTPQVLTIADSPAGEATLTFGSAAK